MPNASDTPSAARRAYVMPHRVSLQETNLVGNVYFAHFASWQGRCREMFLMDHAPATLEDLKGSLRLVTLSMRIDYALELFAGDRLEIHMRLKSSRDHRISMTFEYLVERDGAWLLAAQGEQDVACLRDGGPTPPPADLAAALRRFET